MSEDGTELGVGTWVRLADDVAQEARTFRETVDGLIDMEVGEARQAGVQLLLVALAAVQAAGAVLGVLNDVPLPSTDAYDDWVDDETNQADATSAYTRLVGPLADVLDIADAYARLAHPYDSEIDDVVEARLSEDVAEVYRALDDGMRTFEAGFKLHAAALWQETYRLHWGRHAASAVLALHALLSLDLDDLDQDEDEEDLDDLDQDEDEEDLDDLDPDQDEDLDEDEEDLDEDEDEVLADDQEGK